MTAALLAVLVLAVAGLPLGYALTRSLPLAVVLSPLTGAAVATAATVLMILTGGPLLVWVAPVWLLTGWLAWRRRHRPPVPHGSWRDALLIGGPLLPPYLVLIQEPLSWDAHLIWWLHAGYFTHGGAFTRQAIGNDAISFSHQDYPPMASSAVALGWQALGTHGFMVAALVTGAVTIAASAAVVYAVRVVTAAGPPVVSWLAAIAVGYAAFSPLWYVPVIGYADAMCATAFAAGAVLLLLRPDPFEPRLLPLTMLLLCSAALMKNEGQSMVIALAIVGSVKYRRNLSHVAWVWLPVAVSGVWSATVRVLGAQTDVLAGPRLGELLHGDPDTLGRFPLVFTTMAGRVDRVASFAVAAAALGWLLLRRRRRAFGLPGDLWLWAVAALYWAAITLIYMITPRPLQWHLDTSVDRVVVAFLVLACASAACWAVVACSRPEPQ